MRQPLGFEILSMAVLPAAESGKDRTEYGVVSVARSRDSAVTVFRLQLSAGLVVLAINGQAKAFVWSRISCVFSPKCSIGPVGQGLVWR
jgi:hypothetical protein